MERKAMCSDGLGNEANLESTERDLWAALLKAEGVNCAWDGSEELAEEMFTAEADPQLKTTYPWNPAAPESEAFFNELEQDFSLDDWQAEEVSARANAFFGKVNQLWSGASVQATLSERFAARMPQHLLAAIANRAQQVLSASQSLADQLVQSVQEVLPNVAEEDLYVLARPLAYAMRNGESHRAVDSTLEKVRTIAWDDLSEVEQARLSLAVARCALSELESEGQK